MLMRRMKQLGAKLLPGLVKHRAELRYWRGKHAAEQGQLRNGHYEPLYTTLFDLTQDDYDGKRILDVGCGPRGSLEWAHMALQRVGLDPLAADYQRELGASRHRMEYCSSGSERIPFPASHFDVVTSLNSLDHVDDVGATIREIKRVTKPGGLFLLSVEIDHPPTPAEPISITDAILASFSPEFTVLSEFRIGTPEDHNLHRAAMLRSPSYVEGEPGMYVGKFARI